MSVLSAASSLSDRGHSPRLLLALDKFKGTLTSCEAANALRRGLERGCPTASITAVPVADGGDGTVDAAVSVGYAKQAFVVSGPIGELVTTNVAIRGNTAILEAASVCGLQQLPAGSRHPLESGSHGLGELILILAELGISTVVLGLGGSATTDGGAGMLCALGARFLDENGVPLPAGGGALVRLGSIDWRGLSGRVRDLDIVIASDVDSPLLGPYGAAQMFGPQKGADGATVQLLEDGLKNLVSVLMRCPSPIMPDTQATLMALESGVGAAGGLGFGARLLDSRMVSGASLVLDLLNLRALIKKADLVITGEGCLDRQTLRGKLPVAIARIAAEERIPTIAVVGKSALNENDWSSASLATVWSMNDVDSRTAESVPTSRAVLGFIGEQIAETLVAEPSDDWSYLQRTLHETMRNAEIKLLQQS